MTTEIYLAYVLAAGIVLVIPGPTILLVIGQAVVHGRRSVPPLVTGVMLGDLTAMTFSLMGLGAVMAASAVLFTALKWIGAVYLVFLGVSLWRTDPEPIAAAPLAPDAAPRVLFRRAYIVTALNPKGIAFFVAFLPQFVVPGHPILPQLLLLGATFVLLAGLNAGGYGCFAGQLRDMMQRAAVRRWFNRCGGTALVGAGVFTAALERSG